MSNIPGNWGVPGVGPAYGGGPASMGVTSTASGFWGEAAGTALGWLIKGAMGGGGGGGSSSFTASGPTRAQLEGTGTYSHRRRRRRRKLLTASDKADIAYLVGQLGTGQLGRAAVSALLARRCG